MWTYSCVPRPDMFIIFVRNHALLPNLARKKRSIFRKANIPQGSKPSQGFPRDSYGFPSGFLGFPLHFPSNQAIVELSDLPQSNTRGTNVSWWLVQTRQRKTERTVVISTWNDLTIHEIYIYVLLDSYDTAIYMYIYIHIQWIMIHHIYICVISTYINANQLYIICIFMDCDNPTYHIYLVIYICNIKHTHTRMYIYI